MPLPQPNLDDKSFAALVEEATRLIPRHAPEWSDHNRHDPGITFIELFAWLAEMQQYHLNRIGDESYLKFLKLLGITPGRAAAARAEIAFRTRLDEGVVVPRGTKLSTADGNTIFETEERLTVLPVELKRIFTFTGTRVFDHTDQNGVDGISYYAFGEDAATGSRLYLGFDEPLAPRRIISLHVQLFEDYRVACAAHGREEPSIIPSARILWEFYDAEGNWSPLELNAEFESAIEEFAGGGASAGAGESGCFKRKPQLWARIRQTPSLTTLTREAQAFFEKAVAEAESIEDLRRTLYDTPALMQKRDETLMLSKSGRLFFTTPERMGALVVYPSSVPLYWLRARVTRSGYELPPRIDSINLNTIPAVQQDTLSEVAVFSAEGESDRHAAGDSYLAFYGSHLLQSRDDEQLWRDWTAVEDFEQSAPNDLHYRVVRHEAQQKIFFRFGDGERGSLPPAAPDSLRLISYQPAYEERRYAGRSNGLPGQRFALDQFPVVAEGFMLQVEERLERKPDNRERMDVACLLNFQRIIPSRVRADESFEVKIVLTARQELCEVELNETFTGDLWPVEEESDSPPSGFELARRTEARLKIKRMRAGQVLTRSYRLRAGRRGGSIHGGLRISTAYACPTVVERAPVSIVEMSDAAETPRWRDWTRVTDFDASRPTDAHFVLDETTGEIIFGNGINGRIPPAGSDAAGGEPTGGRIRISAYRTGGGTAGNLAAGQLTRLADVYRIENSYLTDALAAVKNESAATGGAAAEELEEAEARARRDLKTCYQAVTSDDYEYLALATPGLRVARARAIPLFAPGLEDYPTRLAPASVTVVVVPFSTAVKPVPSPEFLRTVCRHLDSHRLITTRVYTVAPEYVRVSVRATVTLLPGFDAAGVTASIEKRLDDFLRPLPAEEDETSEGWPFGRAVYKSEIYQLVEEVEGVDCVERVALDGEGTGALRDRQGSILIPPQSLVYPGEHTIELVVVTPECRSAR